MHNERLMMSQRFLSQEFSNSGISSEVHFNIPQMSLFASIGLTIFEVMLRFESYTISDTIITILTSRIGNYVRSHKDLEDKMNYLFEFIKIHKDSSSLNTSNRIYSLNRYFQQPDIPETISLFIKSLIKEQFTDDLIKSKIEALEFDKNLIRMILAKISDLFAVGFFLYDFLKNEAEIVCTSSEKIPFGVLSFHKEDGIRVLYTAEMIKVEENPEELVPLISQLLIDNKTEPFIIFRSQEIRENQAIGPEPVDERAKSLLINNDGVKASTEPVKKELKEAVKKEINKKRAAVLEQFHPVNPQALQKDVIDYINFTSFLLAQLNIFDESLQNRIKNLTQKYPEIGETAKENICKIQPPKALNQENPLKGKELSSQASSVAPKQPPSPVPARPEIAKANIAINPVPPIRDSFLNQDDYERALHLSNLQNQIKKLCIICFKEKINEDYSDFKCQDCTICNRCRIKNMSYCEMCQRRYDEEEKSLIGVLKETDLRLSFMLGRDSVGRSVQKQTKCKSHGGMEQDDMYSKDFICYGECFACNKCRIRDVENCVVCKRKYYDYEVEILRTMKLSL